MFFDRWLKRKRPVGQVESSRGHREVCPFRPACEPLEDRQLPSVFVVTENTDDGTGKAPGTLSSAITAANQDTVLDTIMFNIGGGGTQVITFGGDLAMDVTQPLVLDGTTQPGWNTAALPQVELDFNQKRGLILGAGSSGSVVRGLALVNASGDGLTLRSDRNQILGVFVGLRANGDTVAANAGDGIHVIGSQNTIGGTGGPSRNVFAGNGGDGIEIDGGSGNLVQGNYVGLAFNGSSLRPNAGNGVHVGSQASGNSVGGTASGARNVIAGNRVDGVRIDTSATNNVVQGNFIGLDASGKQSGKGNGDDGVGLEDTTNNSIVRNVIAQNADAGIEIAGASIHQMIRGNMIGLDAAGLTFQGNAGDGIRILGGTAHVIGGTGGAVDRNVISGNGGHGVRLAGGEGNNQVRGNWIGTDAQGKSPRANRGDGIFVARPSNTIGGTLAGAGNVVSGNAGNGITVTEAGAGTLVQGNLIGTNAGGTGVVANLGDGVTLDGATATTLGGSEAGAGNVIAGNIRNGVRLTSGASRNLLQGNFIGSQFDGRTGLPNILHGVLIEAGAGSNTLGGLANGAGNTIAFNTLNGVAIDPTGGRTVARGNTLSGNAIHDNGLLGIDLGNDGITSNDVQDPDNGANGKMNAPILTGVAPGDAGWVLGGTLNSIASTIFRVEFFASDTADESGQGEGQVFLGSRLVQTDGEGNVSFSLTTTRDLTGLSLSATATYLGTLSVAGADPGETSEFAPALRFSTSSSESGHSSSAEAGPRPIVALGTDLGVPAQVQVLDARTGQPRLTFAPFGAFPGGIRVAVADMNGDGQDDVICAAGPGGLPVVSVRDGRTGEQMTTGQLNLFLAFDPSFIGGLQVAAGDVDGDGQADIIVGADSIPFPVVRIWSGATGEILSTFLAFEPGFGHGVRVATADINGDGKEDVIVGAGPGAQPLVRVFSGADLPGALTELGSGLAFAPNFLGGIHVAGVGDVDGDGLHDLAVTPGVGGAAVVDLFRALANGLQLIRESALLGNGATGVRVAMGPDRNQDGKPDLLAVQGLGRSAAPAVLDTATLGQVDQLFTDLPVGLFIASSRTR